MNCTYCYLRFLKEARAIFLFMIVQFVYSLCTVCVQFMFSSGHSKNCKTVSRCTVYVQFMYSSFATKIILKKNKLKSARMAVFLSNRNTALVNNMVLKAMLFWVEKKQEKYRITMVFYFIIDPILMILLSLPLLCELPCAFLSLCCCCCGRRVGCFAVVVVTTVVAV